MDALQGLRVFRRVVEVGSFVGAADRLNLSTATVSKHVMHIERRVGIRLLNRNTRALSLTEAGRVYFERCKAILDELEDTEQELGSRASVPRGTLRVTCPSWFGGKKLAELLAQYRLRYPDVVVDVSQDDRMVDLVAEGYDVALRVTSNPRSLPAGLIARAVHAVPFFIGAARTYLQRRGAPRVPGDLSAHDFVAIGNLDSLTLHGAEGAVEAPVRVVLRYRSLVGAAHAVAAGIGLSSLPRALLMDPVFSGTFTPVLTEYLLRAPTLYLVYVVRKNAPLMVRTFVDFILESMAEGPAPDSGVSSVRVEPKGRRPTAQIRCKLEKISVESCA